MAASQWSCYDQFLLKLGQKLLNMGTDSFKCALYLSTSNVNNNALSPATYTGASNEIAAGHGYSTGGVALTTAWSNTAGVETFASSNPTWTPSGSGIVCRFAVIYDTTTGDLICWTLLDTTPADYNIQSITIDPAGVFTLQRG